MRRRRAGSGFTVFLGIILLIAGLVWGLVGTHAVSYVNSQDSLNYSIGTGETSGNVYIHVDGSDEYFAALNGDFSPPIAQSDIDNSKSLSFVARTDTTEIDPGLRTDDGKTITQVHKIEKLTFLDNSGATMATYTTSEYTSNPNGVTVNSWSAAIWLVLIGLVLAILGIIGMARKRNNNFSIGGVPPYQPGVPGAMPPYQAGAPGYPPPTNYPPAQPGAYPPPSNPYGQGYPPPNPYNNQPGGSPYQ